MQRLPIILALGALTTLAACNNQPAQDGDGPPTPAALPDPEAPVSIIRPDVEPPTPLPVAPLEPLEATIGFPEGGSELDPAAIAALSDIVKSVQVEKGGPIVLRAHSDAGGSDAANIRASLSRGDNVRDWLVENGVSENRITVIAFGEQNPVKPNALLDGEPNQSGRAANRRVEIEVALPSAPFTPQD